jgi:hypothetical protein
MSWKKLYKYKYGDEKWENKETGSYVKIDALKSGIYKVTTRNPSGKKLVYKTSSKADARKEMARQKRKITSYMR